MYVVRSDYGVISRRLDFNKVCIMRRLVTDAEGAFSLILMHIHLSMLSLLHHLYNEMCGTPSLIPCGSPLYYAERSEKLTHITGYFLLGSSILRYSSIFHVISG